MDRGLLRCLIITSTQASGYCIVTFCRWSFPSELCWAIALLVYSSVVRNYKTKQHPVLLAYSDPFSSSVVRS